MVTPTTIDPMDTPGHGTAQPQATHGLTGRALVIGLLLIPVLCAWNDYSDIVAQATEMAVLSLSIGVVFALLVLLSINALLRAVAPRHALTPSELLYIYVMQTTSIGISSVGMTQFLIMGLGNVFYEATPENRWAQKYQPFLPRWAFPNPKALPAFYTGHSTLLTEAHLRGWLSPFLVWSGFLFVLLVVTLCLCALLRRRWVEQERLSFPIVVLPLSLVNDDARRQLLRNRVFWAGFLVAFLLDNLAAFAYIYPTLPFVPLKASDARLQLSQYLANPPWNAVGELDLAFYPLVIGLTYFLPLDVSCSCWFFFLLTKLENVAVTVWGFRDPGAGAALGRFPYSGEQGLGAFLGLALFSMWNARGYLRQIVREAFARRPSFTENLQQQSYRWVCLGAVVGLIALLAFAVALGTPPLLAVAFLGLYLLVIIAYTRIRAEAGLAWAFGPDMTPHQAIISAVGTGIPALRGLIGLTQFQWLDLDYRCTVMPAQMEAMKIATDARLNLRHLGGAILLATLVGIVASWFSVLMCYYHYGAASAHVDAYRTSMGSTPWLLLDGWTGSVAPTDWPRLEGVAFGVLVTGLLTAARARFLWWPLNPIGYVLSGTFTMVWIWFPIFVGWLSKSLIIRYGGLTVYRLALPFFIGLILGDYVAGSIWAIYGSITGSQPYRIAPI
jgi:hypothetical protein